jgi:hypothetical protein
MSNRPDPASLDVAAYLASEAFRMLAPGTQRMRRRLFKSIHAEIERLSAAEISEARNEIPSETPAPIDPDRPAYSGPWRPVQRRGNWRTA